MKNFIFIILAFVYSPVFGELTLIPSDGHPLTKAFKTWEFSFNDVNSYLVYLIDLASEVAVIVAFIFVIIWWIRYILSLWDNKKSEEAKKTIKNAVLWLCLSAFAWVIIDFIIRLFTA